VDINYLSAEFPDRGLYLRPQDYVSLGISAKIYDWIFSWQAKKILIMETFSDYDIGRINGKRRFQTGGNVFRIGGNTLYDQEIKIPMKIPEFKRSGIRLILKFCGIPNGFPNQAEDHPPLLVREGEHFVKQHEYFGVSFIMPMGYIPEQT
jgi:hypothetical protein